MKISDAGLALIKTFEGFRANSYICPAGVWTIGYGHTGSEIKAGLKITEREAELTLRKDIKQFEDVVLQKIKIPLNQNQFDALVSFVFNIGSGAFSESTLLKRLNNKEDPDTVARTEMPRWNKGGGRVLEGLKRRREAEVELFTKEPPRQKEGLINIIAKHNTWIKKEVRPSSELNSDQKVKIFGSRKIPNCRILDHKDKHTLVEMGYGLGKWWVFDDHWSGLTTDTSVQAYAIEGELRYLRNFPYFYQRDNGPEGWRQCQTSSIAMCLKYIDLPGINDDIDYLKIIKKHGDTTRQATHRAALDELGVDAKFDVNVAPDDIKAQIDKGLPVVAGLLHHGTISHPVGGGHYIVITGYSDTHWLVQDPYGEIDLFNGGWARVGPTVGKNQLYSFKNTNPRIFVSGGADGWCWLNFKLRNT